MQTLDTKPKESLVEKNSDLPEKTIAQNLPAYDMSLIGALEHDHEQLLDLYSKIVELAKDNEYANLQLSLVEFATAFTNHIHVEDEHFYSYLKKLASNKSHLEQKVVAEYASEMKNISISIFAFLSQSPSIPVNELNIQNFMAEFEEIGGLLKDRIEREEKVLYPIYKNSRRVVDIS